MKLYRGIMGRWCYDTTALFYSKTSANLMFVLGLLGDWSFVRRWGGFAEDCWPCPSSYVSTLGYDEEKFNWGGNYFIGLWECAIGYYRDDFIGRVFGVWPDGFWEGGMDWLGVSWLEY